MVDRQDDLFTDEEELKEREYIAFLESKGYTVLKLKQGKRGTTIADVVEHFYSSLQEVSEEQAVLAARLSDKKDFKAVSLFHEKAKKVGLSKAAANESLIDLIDLVFKYFKDTEKPCPVYNLQYIISQNGSWIVQKAVQHHRKFLATWEDSDEAEQIRREIYSDLDSDEFRELQKSVQSKILKEGNNDKEDN
jgi:hypothetical protein